MTQVWKTVRVFISSTFRDMHAERDHLVRFVFPELRERCAKRRLHLVDVDLRWGVTEDEAEQGKALAVCLDEIERCRPFFVGLLGERYGWVPPRYEVPDQPRYDWVREFDPGHSITATEIYHGVLRDPEMLSLAFFYFRDPAFIAALPVQHQAIFLPDNDQAKAKLEELKGEIRRVCVVRENYRCEYGGTDPDGNVLLNGLEAFGQQVLEDLWLAIDQQYPEGESPDNELAVERAFHEAFIEGRSQRFIGRLDLLARMVEYADSEETGTLIVTGVPGCGKSALLANFVNHYAAIHPDVFVLSHFIGVSPGSTDIHRILLRLCRELAEHYQLTEEIPEDYQELYQKLPSILEAASSQAKVLLILDGLNQLDQSHYAHSLNWLPRTQPVGLRLVVSTLEGECLDVMRSRKPSPQEIIIGELGVEERKEIIRQVLGDYRKHLDEGRLDERYNETQMGLLLKKKESDNPLFLIVACEELRVFGEFERVTERIASLPEDVYELFEQVLERLERDHGRELVESALSLLECSRHGLLEGEMLELLRRAGEDQLPQAIWSRLYRSLQFYLRPAGESGEGVLDFFHRQLAKGVRRRYLESEEHKAYSHRRLSELFFRKADPSGSRGWHGNYSRGLSELPYHLLEAMSYAELFRVARDGAFLSAQVRLFPDEPDIHLKTIQAAIEAGARSDDAGAIAEFMLAHVEQITKAAQESPLGAVRAGQLERAWRLAELSVIQRVTTWYLLLAWELKQAGRLHEARETLVRLSKKDLAGLENWQSVLLFWQVDGIDDEVFESLRAQLLDRVGNAALHVLRLNRVDQAAESGREFLGPWTWAEFLHVFFGDNAQRAYSWGATRGSALKMIANEQVQGGDFNGAIETLMNIDDSSDRERALGSLALAQAEAGDFDAALQAAQNIDGTQRDDTLEQIAARQIQIGNLDSALRTEQRIQGEWRQARVLREIALAQTRLGQSNAVRETLGQIASEYDRNRACGELIEAQLQDGDCGAALHTAQGINDDRERKHALRNIAMSLIQAGDFERAAQIAQDINDTAKVFQNIAVAQARDRDVSAALRTVHQIDDQWEKEWALLHVVEALAQTGQFDATREALPEIDGEERRAKAWCALATAQAEAGDNPGALASVESALQIIQGTRSSPTTAELLSDIAKVQTKAGEPAAAQISFEAALHAAERYTDSLRYVVVSQIGAGDLAGAFRTAQKIPDEFSRGHAFRDIELAQQAIVDREADVADAQAQAGNIEAALETVLTISDEQWRDHALVKLAAARANAGNLDFALQVSEMIADHGKRDKLLREIVSAQAPAGNLAFGFEVMQRIRDEKERDWQHLAQAGIQAGDLRAALQAAENIKNDYSSDAVLSDIANSHLEIGDLNAGFEIALKINSNSQRIKMLCKLGIAQLTAGDNDGGSVSLEAALKAAHAETNPAAVGKAIAAMLAGAGAFNAAIQIANGIAPLKEKVETLCAIAVALVRAAAQQTAHEILANARLQTHLLGSAEERSEILKTIAITQLETDDISAARDTFAGVLQTNEEPGYAEEHTETLRAIASAQAQMGERVPAADNFKHALGIAQSIENEWSRAKAQHSIAVAQGQSGDRAASRATFAVLLRDANRIKDDPQAKSNKLRSIAEAQVQAGDVVSARKSLNAAVRTAAALDGYFRAYILSDIAVTNARMGDRHSARSVFEDALVAARECRHPAERAEHLVGIAVGIGEMGEQTAASDILNAAYQAVQHNEDYLRNTMVDYLVPAQIKIGDFNSAVQNAQALGIPGLTVDALTGRAVAQTHSSDREAASASFAAAFQAADQSDSPEAQTSLLRMVGKKQVVAGDLTAALSTFEVALRAAERISGTQARQGALRALSLEMASAGFADQSLRIVDSVITARNQALPEVAGEFAATKDKAHLKHLLIPCAYHLDATYRMCGLLAQLYPEQATAIARAARLDAGAQAAVESEQSQRAESRIDSRERRFRRWWERFLH